MNELSHLRTMVNEDGGAILDLKHGVISTLNVTGGYVWQALERGETRESIIAGLSQKTGESRDVIERDVRAFLAVLEEHQILAP